MDDRIRSPLNTHCFAGRIRRHFRNHVNKTAKNIVIVRIAPRRYGYARPSVGTFPIRNQIGGQIVQGNFSKIEALAQVIERDLQRRDEHRLGFYPRFGARLGNCERAFDRRWAAIAPGPSLLPEIAESELAVASMLATVSASVGAGRISCGFKIALSEFAASLMDASFLS